MRNLILGSMILDTFYNLYNENGREKLKMICVCLCYLIGHFSWNWMFCPNHGNVPTWKFPGKVGHKNICSTEQMWNFRHFASRDFFLLKFSCFQCL